MKLTVRWMDDSEEKILYDNMDDVDLVNGNTCLQIKTKAGQRHTTVPLYNVKYYYVDKTDDE